MLFRLLQVYIKTNPCWKWRTKQRYCHELVFRWWVYSVAPALSLYAIFDVKDSLPILATGTEVVGASQRVDLSLSLSPRPLNQMVSVLCCPCFIDVKGENYVSLPTFVVFFSEVETTELATGAKELRARSCLWQTSEVSTWPLSLTFKPCSLWK